MLRHLFGSAARRGLVGLMVIAGGVVLPAQIAPAADKETWTPISASVLAQVKPGYPGKTAGVAVDPANGDVYMVVPDQGLWKSSDRGGMFARIDGGKIGGRCETGFALDVDPAGKRMMCFMIYGSSAWTDDAGKSWNATKTSHLDFGAVDWEASGACLLALRHEAGGMLTLSTDAGKTWKDLHKGFTHVGLFSDKALLAGKGMGIVRSEDGGETWASVSDTTPSGSVMRVRNGVGYWTTPRGLLVSKDQGRTWDAQGSPVAAIVGPFFGKKAEHMIVVGKEGFHESIDGGESWKRVAPLPVGFGVGGVGPNYAWDPIGNVFYASSMGKETFRYEREGAKATDNVHSLIDGKTLDRWAVENGAEVEARDGALLLKGGDGWLRSHHTYGDFKLHVEWKALQGEAYDAGVYLRASADGAPFPKTGYQANMLQGKEGNIGSLPGASSAGLIKPGDWNAFDITAVGETIEMVINGKPAYKVTGATIPRGYVGLQVEVPKGGQFLVRSFQVTELDFRPLFNGKDLTGWEGAGQPAEKCWAVEDGLLVCKQSEGPWLRSLEEYGDFNLRLDYRLGNGANSGVYVRVPKDGNHHRENDTLPPAGFEVQVLDDHAEKYAKLKDYQYSASVYDIAGANPRVTKPAGQWNTLEIDCRGQSVTTIHNGVTVARVTPQTHPPITLREVKGYLGLQNHGGGVAFRNVRLGPATK